MKILLSGCCGHMGKEVARTAAELFTDADIIAGVDAMKDNSCSFPVAASFDEADTSADVIIDFAAAAAVDALLDYAAERQIPVVLCTTGLSAGQLNEIEACAQKVAILRSANMSLGINLLMKLVREAAATLYEAGFDIEIVEKHHNQKVDAPSGTAIALADAVQEGLSEEMTYVYDRSQVRQKRDRKEIGFASVRGGTITGDHDVIFAGTDEVVTFSHQAYSKAVFARGAVSAARFLAGKPAGLYAMSDVVGV